MNRAQEEQKPAVPEIPTVMILGVRVHCVDFQQTLALISHWIGVWRKENGAPSRHIRAFPHQICTLNPEFVMDARRDPAFGQVLASADLCVADGIGVLWAARLAGVHLQERVTGSDGIYRLCERAALEGWRVFLLGAGPGIADQAAQELMTLYPGLPIVDTFGGSPAEADWPHIRQQLYAAQPDLLFVAYGHPQQDFWIHQHRHELPVAVAVGVGGAFDFVAGITQRAPLWIQRLGLEWLDRLIRQPWRWRRMAVLPLFALLVVMEWFTTLVRGDMP